MKGLTEENILGRKKIFSNRKIIEVKTIIGNNYYNILPEDMRLALSERMKEKQILYNSTSHDGESEGKNKKNTYHNHLRLNFNEEAKAGKDINDNNNLKFTNQINFLKLPSENKQIFHTFEDNTPKAHPLLTDNFQGDATSINNFENNNNPNILISNNYNISVNFLDNPNTFSKFTANFCQVENIENESPLKTADVQSLEDTENILTTDNKLEPSELSNLLFKVKGTKSKKIILPKGDTQIPFDEKMFNRNYLDSIIHHKPSIVFNLISKQDMNLIRERNPTPVEDHKNCLENGKILVRSKSRESNGRVSTSKYQTERGNFKIITNSYSTIQVPPDCIFFIYFS